MKRINFSNIEEAVEALNSIKKLDLSSKKVQMQDAVKFCCKVLEALKRCQNLNLSGAFNQGQISNALKAIGCVGRKNVARHLVDLNIESIYDMLRQKDITFPVSLFGQLIDKDPSTFEFAFLRATDGYDESWIDLWLQTQGVVNTSEMDVTRSLKRDFNKINDNKTIDGQYTISDIDDASEQSKRSSSKKEINIEDYFDDDLLNL